MLHANYITTKLKQYETDNIYLLPVTSVILMFSHSNRNHISLVYYNFTMYKIVQNGLKSIHYNINDTYSRLTNFTTNLQSRHYFFPLFKD